MKSRLEKLEEFAEWACKDHLENAMQCLKFCHYSSNNIAGDEIVLKQFDFEWAQYRRWAEMQTGFKIMYWYQKLDSLRVQLRYDRFQPTIREG